MKVDKAIITAGLTVRLFADEMIWQYRDDHPAEWATYGCGPGGLGDYLVPDTMWGLSVTECCRFHDGYYRNWPENTEVARQRADEILLNNCVRVIEAAAVSGMEHIGRDKYQFQWCHDRAVRRVKWLYEQRLDRAHLYFKMVRRFGAPAYFEDRNDKEIEYRAVAIG